MNKAKPAFLREQEQREQERYPSDKRRRLDAMSAVVPDSAVSKRKGQGNNTFSYVKTGYVKTKLLEHFGEHMDISNEVLPQTWEHEGKTYLLIKTTIATDMGTRSEIMPVTSNELVTNVWKSAQSKNLKRVAVSFGNCFGLSLYNQK